MLILMFYVADVTPEVRSTCSIRSSPSDRGPSRSVAVELRVNHSQRGRGPPNTCRGPPRTGSVDDRASPGRRPSRRGRSPRVSQVPQGVDTSAAATGVRQVVPHCSGTGYEAASQTHLQGNCYIICITKCLQFVIIIK